MSAPCGYDWPTWSKPDELARTRAELSALRAGLEALVAEAERRLISCPTARLVPAARIRRLLEGKRSS